MSSYPRLRRAMDAIPLIDAHSHVLHHDIIPQTPDGPYDVLPLARLLLDFNTRPVFLSAGFPAEAVDRILKGHVSPDTQKQLLLSCRGIWSVQELRFLLRGLKKLYGIDVPCITPENWDTVNCILAREAAPLPQLLERIFQEENIQSSVLNLWADRGFVYLTQRDRSPENGRYLFSITVDYRSLVPFGKHIGYYAAYFSMPQETLADYEALLERICRWAVLEQGVRAFKSTEMYSRRLDYQPRTRQEAERCYKPRRTAEEDRILSDYHAFFLCRIAQELNVPVQFHTGNVWGGFVPADTSPEHLATLIRAFPRVRFDLLHGGDPYFGITALMGRGFSNVFVNMSAMPTHSAAEFEHWLSVYLDRIPSTKLLLGWDLFTPELLCGAAAFTRDMLARVLSQKVDAGLFSEELALEVAQDLCWRNAQTLYGR